jgi:hypothetical protein
MIALDVEDHAHQWRKQAVFALLDHDAQATALQSNQAADRMIGIENIPPELRVAQVIGEEWIYPNDPRIAEKRREQAQSAG